MEDEVMMAGMSLLGAIIGTGGGVIFSTRLTLYRISQLEIKMDKHNNLIERVLRLEGRMDHVEKDICEAVDNLHEVSGDLKGLYQRQDS